MKSPKAIQALVVVVLSWPYSPLASEFGVPTPEITPDSSVRWSHSGLDIEGNPEMIEEASLALSCPTDDLNGGDQPLVSLSIPGDGERAPVRALLAGNPSGLYLIWCRVKDVGGNWSDWGKPLLVHTSGGNPACERPAALFVRGDSNSDGAIDISDMAFTLLFLFGESRLAMCLDAVDTDDSSQLNLTDAIYLGDMLFADGPLPPPPGIVCGPDETADELTCEVDPPCL